MHGPLAEGLPDPSRGAMATFLNRPDHLTRSARELVRWDDVVTSGAAATLPPHAPVRTVQTSNTGRVAFLTREADAALVNAAILETIAAVRGPHQDYGPGSPSAAPACAAGSARSSW